MVTILEESNALCLVDLPSDEAERIAWCPRCYPEQYALLSAKHRKDEF